MGGEGEGAGGGKERREEQAWMVVMFVVTVGLLVWVGSKGRSEINRIIQEIEEEERERRARGEGEGGEREGLP